LGSKLLAEDAASVLIVMNPDGGSTNNDTIGWGGCGDENRFNTHFAVNGALVFQMGNANHDQISPAAPLNWSNHPHVVTVVRHGSYIRLSVDGHLLKNAQGFEGKLKTSITSPIVIAGNCSNGFKGKISEVLFFDKALEEKKELALVRYLANKYRISLTDDQP
jgi:hypothetical protein